MNPLVKYVTSVEYLLKMDILNNKFCQ